ncbi:MAG TPA: adenosylcobinamide-GDP ribazoletransferase [Clostridiales bacterium]|nr:adenosylcobinamide-GDP ribazoletransferase [Clostridiales bacterium]
MMWKEFRIAVSFLTRLPLSYQGEWDERSFSRASVFYPLVGLIVGAIVGFVVFLLRFTGFYELAAVAALITAVAVSGGIHLDGFMDMCDGLFASRGRERALEIMKDSHVGSFAVIGVVLLLLLKFTLYQAVIASPWFFGAILGAFVFSRFMLICCMLCFPAARAEGLGVTVKRYVSKPALFWGVLLLAAIFAVSGYYPLLIAFFFSFLIMMGLSALINHFLKGLTGDIYGAMAEIGEAVFLLMIVICNAVAMQCNVSLTVF